MRVAEFFASVSLRPDPASMRATMQALARVRSMLLGLGAAAGIGAIVGKMVRLNVETEQVRTQIAGMLALSNGTDLASEMGAAADSVQRLRERAAGLPGTFREYANFLGRITQQASRAGLGIRQIEDLTVGAVVASKALHVQWQVGARDIDQFLQGRWSIRDELTTKLMTAIGIEDRKSVNAMTREERAALLMRAFQSKQIAQLAEAQANTVGGRLEKLRDQWELFLLRVGGPLFGALGDALAAANRWIDEHRDKLAAVAEVAGGVLRDAFDAFRGVIAWLVGHDDVLLALLGGIAATMGVIAARSLLAAAPALLLVARLSALVWIFRALRDKIGPVGAALMTAFGAALLFRLGAVARGVRSIIGALVAARTAAAAIPAAQGAGAAINGMSGLALGPAGAAARGAPTLARGAPATGGGIGLLGAVGLPLIAAIAVDELIPRDARIDGMLGDWGAMRAFARGDEMGRLGRLQRTTNNVNVAGDTITITGVRDAAEVERILDERDARKQRALMHQLGLAGRTS